MTRQVVHRGRKIQVALETPVAPDGQTLTRDVGGTAGTTQFADAVLAAMS